MSGAEAETAARLLLWAQVLLVWVVACHGTANDPAGYQEFEELREHARLDAWRTLLALRAGAAGAIAALLPGLHAEQPAARLLLAVVVGGGTFGLVQFRCRLAVQRVSARRTLRPVIPDLRVQRGVWLAEWEIVASALLAIATWVLIASAGLTVRPSMQVPVSTARLSAVIGSVAILLWAVRGGAVIVRGVLNKVEALPRAQSHPADVDLLELSRGRLIGILERFTLVLLVAAEAYAAIGFLIAAKGLIRSRELEDRRFAEYFLVGTLTSVAVALVAGFAVQLLLTAS